MPVETLQNVTTVVVTGKKKLYYFYDYIDLTISDDGKWVWLAEWVTGQAEHRDKHV